MGKCIVKKPNPIWRLQNIEQAAMDALRYGCWGYDCIEYDNGTFECDDCPAYQKYSYLTKKAERLIREGKV